MYSFKHEFKKRYGSNYELASKELGKSVRTLQRYIKNNKCDLTVKYLLTSLNQEYIHPDWKSCYWRSDGNLNTPYGIVRYSDVLLVHRYKWHSQVSGEQLRKLKELNSNSDAYIDDLIFQLSNLLDNAKKLKII